MICNAFIIDSLAILLPELLKSLTVSMKVTIYDLDAGHVLQFFILCDILGITDINDAFDIAVEDNLYAQFNDEGLKTFGKVVS